MLLDGCCSVIIVRALCFLCGMLLILKIQICKGLSTLKVFVTEDIFSVGDRACMCL